MRWLEWGFEGRAVENPWGDHVGERWVVQPTETRESLVTALRERGVITGTIVRRHELDERVAAQACPQRRRLLADGALEQRPELVGHVEP